jgi:alpha-L-fucosidase 2
MGDPYHPRGYPYVRGVNICLKDGKLSASLNQLTAAAKDTFPLNQWVQVIATYDGNALTLYADGNQMATTTDFPTAEDVMGWNKEAIHYGAKGVPFDGCGPEGIMVQRVTGTAAKEDAHGLRFSLLPNEQATLLLSVVTDRNALDYLSTARQMVGSADAAFLNKLYQAHIKSWDAFWSKSYVRIPDSKIQDSWYASLYLLTCCSSPASQPPGLWGNFVTMRDMGWQGDYTLNYNYEAPFWAAYPTNHLELTDNYEKPLLDFIPRGLVIAQHEHQQGLYFYTHLVPPPGWDDDQSTFMKQKGCTLYALVNCAQRWKYTYDPAYAKKIYPLLKGVADFWDNYLVLQDGHYVDHDDAAGEEENGNNNTTTTLAFIRLIYPSLIEISKLLNQDADRRNKWQDIVDKLAPFPVVPAATVDHIEGQPDDRNLQDLLGADLVQNKMVIRNSDTGYGFPSPMIKVYQDKNQRTSSPGMNSSQAIFPAWAIGLESEPSLRDAAFNTVDFDSHWFDANNDCAFYPAAACIGYDPKAILQHLDELVSTEFPSFIIPTRGGGTEDFAIVPATISAMFLQSYQQNIHLFPNWPMDQDASFGNLAACGGFLISSQIAQGQVKYVQIQSNAGQECRLVNPWPKATIQGFSIRRAVFLMSGTILKFQTIPGEVFILEPHT